MGGGLVDLQEKERTTAFHSIPLLMNKYIVFCVNSLYYYSVFYFSLIFPLFFLSSVLPHLNATL